MRLGFTCMLGQEQRSSAFVCILLCDTFFHQPCLLVICLLASTDDSNCLSQISTDVQHSCRKQNTMLSAQNLPPIVCSVQALLRALKLGSACKQPWLVANSAIAIWNTYLPNMLQQRFAPLLDLLMSAVTTLLAQPDPGAIATQLTALATAGAAAAEHAALLAVLAASPTNKHDSVSLPAGSL